MASYIPPLEIKTIRTKTGKGMNGKGMGKDGCQINVYQINGRAEDAERKREFVRGMLVRGMGRGLRRFATAFGARLYSGGLCILSQSKAAEANVALATAAVQDAPRVNGRWACGLLPTECVAGDGFKPPFLQTKKFVLRPTGANGCGCRIKFSSHLQLAPLLPGAFAVNRAASAPSYPSDDQSGWRPMVPRRPARYSDDL